MKFLFDLFPVILFFIVFKWGENNLSQAQALVEQYLSGLMGSGTVAPDQAPILIATSVAILATIAQIGYLLLRKRKVDGMLWVSLAIIVIFGGATIYFHSDTFIKWKPTVLYWIFALGLGLSPLIAKKNLIKAMMEKSMSLPDVMWARLNFSWVGFFALMGALNLFVAFNFPTSTWVNFKLFGVTVLMIVFVVGQMMMLSKYLKDVP
ncbi:MAG: septation protein A [Pseudomonadota bacterium]